MLRRPLKYGAWEKIVFEPSRWILDFGEDMYTCSVNLNVIMHSLLKESAWGKTYVGHLIWIPAFREHVQFLWWQFQIYLLYWLSFWNMAARGNNKLGVSVGVQVGGRVPQEFLFGIFFRFVFVSCVRPGKAAAWGRDGETSFLNAGNSAGGISSCVRHFISPWCVCWRNSWVSIWNVFELLSIMSFWIFPRLSCHLHVLLGESYSNIGRKPACWWYNCGF